MTGKPHPVALRDRVAASWRKGTRTAQPPRGSGFRVSVTFVNGMVILKGETGGLAPRAQGNGGGHGKLAGVQDRITARMDAKPDLTLNDLVGEPADHHGIAIHRVSVWQFLRSLGLTHKQGPASRRAEAA